MAYTEFVTNVMNRLAGVAPTARGEDNISGDTSAAPRIVFVWKHCGLAPANRWLHGQSSTNNPRPISVDQHDIEVHLWAADSTGLETLRAAVLLAVRAELKGRRYADAGMIPSRETPLATGGAKGVMTLHVFLEAPGVTLPATTPVATAGSDPTAAVVPATLPTVAIAAVSEIDPTGAVAGDGLIDFGEP